MLDEVQGNYDGTVAFESVEEITQAHVNVYDYNLIRLDLAQLPLLSVLYASRDAVDEDTDHTLIDDIRIHGFFNVVFGSRLHQSRF